MRGYDQMKVDGIPLIYLFIYSFISNFTVTVNSGDGVSEYNFLEVAISCLALKVPTLPSVINNWMSCWDS